MKNLFREKESDLEERICKYAKQKGWRAHKWTSPGRRGVTDRFFTKSPGRIVFMEIKRDENEDATVQQKKEQQKLRDQGFSVFTIQYYEEACAILDER